MSNKKVTKIFVGTVFIVLWSINTQRTSGIYKNTRYNNHLSQHGYHTQFNFIFNLLPEENVKYYYQPTNIGHNSVYENICNNPITVNSSSIPKNEKDQAVKIIIDKIYDSRVYSCNLRLHRRWLSYNSIGCQYLSQGEQSLYDEFTSMWTKILYFFDHNLLQKLKYLQKYQIHY